MVTINPYINFNGNAEEAFDFYKSVFGGEFETIIRFKDLGAEVHVTENDANKIMRIALPIGGNILIANDVPTSMGPVNENENRSKISVRTESRAEADKIFTGLTVGGAIEMPMSDTSWDTYFGMFRDKFGIEWTVEFDPKGDGQAEEIKFRTKKIQ
jgi:PhnB protein